MPFILLCPQIYSGGPLAVAASAWCSEGRGWAGTAHEEPSRRQQIWPAATAAKKMSVADQLGKAIAATWCLGQPKRNRDWQPGIRNTTLRQDMGHLFTVITQIQGIIQGKEQDCCTMPAAHACCQKLGATTRNTHTEFICSCPNSPQELGKAISLHNTCWPQVEVLTSKKQENWKATNAQQNMLHQFLMSSQASCF